MFQLKIDHRLIEIQKDRETERESEGGTDNTSEGEADRDDTLYRAWKKEEKVQLALWKNHKK